MIDSSSATMTRRGSTVLSSICEIGGRVVKSATSDAGERTTRGAMVSLSRHPAICNDACLLSGVSRAVFTHRYSAALWLALYVTLQIGASHVSPPVRSPAAFIALALLSNALFIFLALAICASVAYAV